MKTEILSKEELRSILGGKAASKANDAAAQGFPCRVIENGEIRVITTETIEECLEFGGYK